MKYEIGDIVKANKNTWPDIDGIFEITSFTGNKSTPYIITNGTDEFFANDERLILVCPYKERKDI